MDKTYFNRTMLRLLAKGPLDENTSSSNWQYRQLKIGEDDE
jgi:hypothetical protein